MFKKIIIVFYVLLFAAVASLGANFYWKNLRGIKPVVMTPPYDIAKKIENSIESSAGENTTGLPLKVPSGFSIGIFAKDLGKPRFMAIDPEGTLLVSIPANGEIAALPDNNSDGIADEKIIVAKGLNKPHGMVFRCPEPLDCKLYVAEEDKLTIMDYDQKTKQAVLPMTVFKLPGGGTHITRSVLIAQISEAATSSDGRLETVKKDKLIVSAGSSCNLCEEKNPLRASILISDLDGSNLRVFASGLRNAVIPKINPATGEIWTDEMGRDLLGDDLPPDEINIIKDGADYGWPLCYGKNIHDTDFDKKKYAQDPCADKEPSYIDLPAHNAPLGIAFFPPGWPAIYKNDMLVALHGSWNRSAPDGYKIVRFALDERGQFENKDKEGKPVMVEFISGWLTADGRALGRPVDIQFKDGSIFVSDDKAGVIYRIINKNYKGPGGDSNNTAPPAQKASTGKIHVSSPSVGSIVKSPLEIDGEAVGGWYFEASFPAALFDSSGKELARVPIQAIGGWMTDKLVPFNGRLEFETPLTATGTLVLEKDNPSGLPENAEKIEIPVRFK
jgi:glucose/arabinose dehydrogenase